MGWERQTLDAGGCMRSGLVRLAAGGWLLDAGFWFLDAGFLQKQYRCFSFLRRWKSYLKLPQHINSGFLFIKFTFIKI
jgi:hypothetical protein